MLELLMKNIDLFNFKFVDRENERMIVKNFILSSNIDNALWIHGDSGVGKTELVKYFSNHFPNEYSGWDSIGCPAIWKSLFGFTFVHTEI